MAIALTMPKTTSTHDPFGFRFWLGWILGFAASFVFSAALWTLLITWIFGEIRGAELTLSWSLAVFGTWFLFVVPFMRKKERIWKRLNTDQEKAADLWLAGIGISVGGLIASALGWSFIYREHLHQISTGFHGPWVKAVFASWLVCLIPFLLMMYRRADKLFQEAHARQTQRGPVFKSVFVEKSKRLLPAALIREIESFPATLENGKMVRFSLKDGRETGHAFVLNSREILGLYGCDSMDFEAADILKVRAVPADEMPAYQETRWLRLDGRI